MASQAAVSTKPLHVLRGLFRLLKTPQLSPELVKNSADRTAGRVGLANVAAVASSSHHHIARTNASTAFLMRKYRETAALSATATTATTTNDDVDDDDHYAAEIERLRKIALECYLLRRDLASRAELYAMDAGVDQILTPKETSRRAAARAGLQLPELYDSGMSMSGSKESSS